MTLATTVQNELKKIRREALDPDRDSPDLVLRLFAERHLAEGARLRALYADRLKAEANCRTLAEKIAAAHQELMQLRATHLARWDAPTIDTDLPTDAEALAYATAKDKAALIRSLSEAWEGQVISYKLQSDDRGKAWDAEFVAWCAAVWRLTGNRNFQTSWVIVDGHTDANGWCQPEGYERAALEATLARIEA